MTEPVDDVYAYLLAHGIAGGSTLWALLRRRMVDAPEANQLVVISEDGGSIPEIEASSGIGDAAMADPAVMVSVRAGAWDGDASHAKAREIYGALHGLRNVALSSGGGATKYLRIRAQSEVIFAGYDEQGRPRHNISFRLLRQV